MNTKYIAIVLSTLILIASGFAIASLQQETYNVETLTQAEIDTAKLLQAIELEQHIQALYNIKKVELENTSAEATQLLNELQEATRAKFSILLELGMK